MFPLHTLFLRPEEARRYRGGLRLLRAALSNGLPEAVRRTKEYERRRLFERFASDGRAGDFGEWDDIAEETAEGRERPGAAPERALWDRGDLAREMSTPHVEGGRLWFETDAPHARALEEGSPENDLPARPFAYVGEEEQERVPTLYLGELADLVDEVF